MNPISDKPADRSAQKAGSTDESASVEAFIANWQGKDGGERANYQLFIFELCELLGVPTPRPSSSDNAENSYVFERCLEITRTDADPTRGYIDCYKRDCFVLETKQGVEKKEREALSEAGREREKQRRTGHGIRGSRTWDASLVKARNQADRYARALPASEGRPPFLVVADVGHCIELYSEFTCTGGVYTPFPDPRSHRIFLKDLAKEEVRERLRTLWTAPLTLDPATRTAQVTRDIADRLARLAKSLEASGHSPAAVGGFLMRCIFTMFAEDVNLLPRRSFHDLLVSVRDNPQQFVPLVRSVWDGMNDGGFCVALRHTLLRFNGGLFEERTPLPVTSDQIDLLIEAAKADWRDVEPAIFGTLLERALDPRDRHKLGAHYTPRDYVERLVMPTVIEPLRDEWSNVQAAAAAHLAEDKEKLAVKTVREFLDHLCRLRVLDPACGSGNFLYVTMEHMKRLEGEVLDLLNSLGESQTGLELEGHTVHPTQFIGIEVNPRAAVLAELCLWIGYLQWHYRTRGEVSPPEPVISKFHTIECRDAVLAYDSMTPVELTQRQDAATTVEAASSRLPESETKRQDAASTAASTGYFNPYKKVETSKANLPHWRQEGVTYFVTFRLADSLPQKKLEQWKAERDAWLAKNPKPHTEEQKSEYFENFSARMEAWLDAGHGDCVLTDKACAEIVESALRHFDGDRYDLGKHVVATNHVHALVTPKAENELSEIIHSWKSYTAKELNKHLGRTGQVWQKEYYDHILRSASAAYHIEQYIGRHRNVAAASSRLSETETERQDAASTVAAASSRSPETETQRQDAATTATTGQPIYLTRWDGHTFKKHPVTGEAVPDESVTIPVYRYENPRPAEWPQADYIVGNPPFIGAKYMRDALGDGYTETLRKTYKDLPESIDFVMYWWHKAAELARAGKIRRFGLITTNSLRQTFNRRVIKAQLEAKKAITLRFAIPDHPWVENADAAAVRIAMTVAEAGEGAGILAKVIDETEKKDGTVAVQLSEERGAIHSDLTIGANLAAAVPLQANTDLSCPGVKLHGSGFIVTEEEAVKLGLGRIDGLENYIRTYRNGNDLTQRPRGVKVIDLFGLEADDVRTRFPEVYQWVADRVKLEREAKAHSKDGAAYAKQWWLFGKTRASLRAALRGLPRYVATPVTSKHRFFEFISSETLPDDALMNFSFENEYLMGILSSKPHVVWALHMGAKLGPTPRYIKTRCFETFPFPDLDDTQKAEIGRIAEALDAHRKAQIAAHPKLTMTGLYNVLEKVKTVEAASSRSSDPTERQDAASTAAPLTAKEKTIYDEGLVAVLRELHDELDAAVLAAYGWPDLSPSNGSDLNEQELLTRLVNLNQHRAAEEAKGQIRWLRPEYQNPEIEKRKSESGNLKGQQEELPGTKLPQASGLKSQASALKMPWPKTMAEQAAAVRDLIRRTGWTSDQDIKILSQHFKGARTPKVQAIAEALVALGQAA